MRWLLPLALLVVAACREEPIEVRREAEAAPFAAANARPRGLRWTTPAGWKERAGAGMRAATFELPSGAGKAEATAVSLPGDVGGELANVNRWRGQIALPPLTQAQLAGERRELRSRAGTVVVYDFTNEQRLIAGMIQVKRVSWFFKLMGDEQAVVAQKPNLLKLLESLRADGP